MADANSAVPVMPITIMGVLLLFVIIIIAWSCWFGSIVADHFNLNIPKGSL